MSGINIEKYESPFGIITITGRDECCTGIFLRDIPELDIKQNHMTQKIKNWLADYFNGKKPVYPDVQFVCTGTPFQKLVWEITKFIPYGKTITYGYIASIIGFIKNGRSHARAVGNALNKNPFPLIIPCHRIIGSNSAGGFAYGNEIKKWLLDFEQ